MYLEVHEWKKNVLRSGSTSFSEIFFVAQTKQILGIRVIQRDGENLEIMVFCEYGR